MADLPTPPAPRITAQAIVKTSPAYLLLTNVEVRTRRHLLHATTSRIRGGVTVEIIGKRME